MKRARRLAWCPRMARQNDGCGKSAARRRWTVGRRLARSCSPLVRCGSLGLDLRHACHQAHTIMVRLMGGAAGGRPGKVPAWGWHSGEGVALPGRGARCSSGGLQNSGHVHGDLVADEGIAPGQRLVKSSRSPSGARLGCGAEARPMGGDSVAIGRPSACCLLDRAARTAAAQGRPYG